MFSNLLEKVKKYGLKDGSLQFCRFQILGMFLGRVKFPSFHMEDKMNKLTSEAVKAVIQVEQVESHYKAMVLVAVGRVRYATGETRESAVDGLIQKIS